MMFTSDPLEVLVRILILATVGTFWAATVSAQTHAVGQISLIRTGWAADSFAVVLNVPQLNPARCGTADGYISDSSLAGYKTFYSAALTAFTMNQTVQVVIHDRECFNGRPKLIGINLPR